MKYLLLIFMWIPGLLFAQKIEMFGPQAAGYQVEIFIAPRGWELNPRPPEAD